MGLRDKLKQKLREVVGQGGKTSASRGGPLPTTPAPDGYRAVARSEQVGEGKPGTFPLFDGTIVAVFRRKDRLYVMDNACAHEDGPVGEGAVQDCKVRCPYHDWEYDFTTGACITDPERQQTTWKVREADGVIWVGPKLTEGTGARGGDHNDGLKVIKR